MNSIGYPVGSLYILFFSLWWYLHIMFLVFSLLYLLGIMCMRLHWLGMSYLMVDEFDSMHTGFKHFSYSLLFIFACLAFYVRNDMNFWCVFIVGSASTLFFVIFYYFFGNYVLLIWLSPSFQELPF